MPSSKRSSIVQKEEEQGPESKDDFIRRCFTYKECTNFVPVTSGEGSINQCGCGEMKEFHFMSEDPEEKQTKWSPDFIRTIGSTNAFGVVDFYSGAHSLHKSAEMLRMTDDDDLLNLIELMDKYWKLLGDNAPLLCISVIGGMDKIDIDITKRNVFCEGLIGAVNATNAWIVTHGLNTGVVEIVADAISRAEMYHLRSDGESSKINCIGVAPWGFVHNRDRLVKVSYSRFNYGHHQYEIIKETPPGEPVSLNKYHSHYVLFDDGIRNSLNRTKIAKFRRHFEHLIATPRVDGGCGVPVVQLILSGAFDAIEYASQSVRSGIPIVVCGGTGGAADVLERALHYKELNRMSKFFTVSQLTELREMLEGLNDNRSEEDKATRPVADQGIDLIRRILSKDSFITCFDLTSGDTSLDGAIIFALIKSATTNPLDQLMIALKFGRIDVVKENILSDGGTTLRTTIDREKLHELMTLALLENRGEFVEFLLEQELVEMSNYLNVGTLNSLYNDLHDTSTIRRVMQHYKVELERSPTSLTKSALAATTANVFAAQTSVAKDANNLLQMIFNKVSNKKQDWTNLPTIKRLLKTLLGSFESNLYVEVTPFTRRILFPQPLQELFVWAVLNDRNDLALIFWRNADDALALSLIGCNLYNKMLKGLPYYATESRTQMSNQKTHLENSAKMMIELCYSRSRWKALYLLVRPFKTWGLYRCVSLAMQADCLEFISSLACQHAIRFEWRSGIHANVASLILAFFCPFFIFSPIIRFAKDGAMLGSTSDKDIFQRLKGKIKHREKDAAQVSTAATIKSKLTMFYHAPRTKFCAHTFAYGIFLTFFSYTLLFGMQANDLTNLEAALIFYLGAFGVETIRSFLKSIEGTGSFRFLLGKWLRDDKWHIYDVTLVLLSIATLCLRIGFETTYIVAKSFYSVILVLFYLRLFKIYSVNRRLGPQSVMIFRMLVELSMFLLVLVIFLVPYGVSTQALLYPYMTEFRPETLKDVFYYPYYRIYGELFLQQSEAQLEECKGKPADGINCPVYNFMAPLFLAIYMLIVVILLVNLLIAIFSNVFSAIETQSLQFWKSTMFYLLMEYKMTTILPTPFSVFEAIVEGLAYTLNWTVGVGSRLGSSKSERNDDGHENGSDGGDGTRASPGYTEMVEEEMGEEEAAFERSITQMQHWAIRQMLKQEAFEGTDYVPSIYHMVEEIHNIVSNEFQGPEPKETEGQGSHLRAPSPGGRKTSVRQKPDLTAKVDAIESRLENLAQRQEEILKLLAERKESRKK